MRKLNWWRVGLVLAFAILGSVIAAILTAFGGGPWWAGVGCGFGVMTLIGSVLTINVGPWRVTKRTAKRRG